VGILFPSLFVLAVAAGARRYDWIVRWLLSGAPFLTFIILLGSSRGTRVLPIFPLWTLLSTLNLVYAVSATSWLFYGLFTAWCYPAIFVTSLFQFPSASRQFRRVLRKTLKQLQFVNDKIALFDIPALEIDVDVDGLMVVRGIEFSLSTLTVVAHGIEVGIKLSNDMELAISTEKVTIAFFRGIEISDCFANVKGGEREMTFGHLDAQSKDEDGNALMVEATPLLTAAAANADTSRPRMVKMTSHMTNGTDLRESTAREGFKSITKLSPNDELAVKQYEQTLDWIQKSNMVEQCRKAVKEDVKIQQPGEGHEEEVVDLRNINEIRAAICSRMHTTPSVPHPPETSIKVTTLQNLSSPRQRRFMHRLPMLLRLLLNPIAYFHPVTISSITAGGSGKWIAHMLKGMIFKDYPDDVKELAKLEDRILQWLSDANFVAQLADIHGIASVPFLTSFDIATLLKIGDVMAYRTVVSAPELEQVLRLGGADASFEIPSFLLPHHEHLLPPKPLEKDIAELTRAVSMADGKPHKKQAQHDLAQAKKDEANVQISVHARLPACFSQELLDFISAVVKATKVAEIDGGHSALDDREKGFKALSKAVAKDMRDGMKKTMVDGIVNDKWIAKMVGKITKKLEEAQGEVGYSGDIPVQLEKYRLPEGHPEASKLLP
jgi:hypothetical protein